MRKSLSILVGMLFVVCFGVAPAAAESDGVAAVSAKVDGRDVSTSTMGEPLRLVPDQWVDVELRVVNNTDHPVHLARLDLTGRVLELVFFNYMAPFDLTVAPGATQTVQYRFRLIGLAGQATGLMRGDVAVTDDNGHRVASLPMVSDVHGSLVSVYGLFGLALLVLTVLASIDAALALRRNRLSSNRVLRGLRLLTPGVGVGLVLLFTATVLRIWVPRTSVWLIVAAGVAVAFFAAGYLTVRPSLEDDDDAAEERETADGERPEVAAAPGSEADTGAVTTIALLTGVDVVNPETVPVAAAHHVEPSV